MIVSSFRCWMLVSIMNPVTICIAVFCIVWSCAMIIVRTIVDHKVEAYSNICFLVIAPLGWGEDFEYRYGVQWFGLFTQRFYRPNVSLETSTHMKPEKYLTPDYFFTLKSATESSCCNHIISVLLFYSVLFLSKTLRSEILTIPGWIYDIFQRVSIYI